MNKVSGNRFRHNAALAQRPSLYFGMVEEEDCVFITLPNKAIAFTNIDLFPTIKDELFQASRGYVVRHKSKMRPELSRWLHRIACPAPDGCDVDHINGNRLDNRRSNLRIATRSQNNHNNHKLSRKNRSGKTGVSWHEKLKKWLARIAVNGKIIHIGVYLDLKKAVAARRQAELIYYGEFAPQVVMPRTLKKP